MRQNARSRRVHVFVLGGAGAVVLGLLPHLLPVSLTPVTASAATASVSAFSWGDNGAGELGTGAATVSPSPVPVNLPSGVVAVSAGGAHSLALTSAGAIWAWGDNVAGEAGNGSPTTGGCYCVASPVSVSPGTTFSAVAAGTDDSLAISSGEVYAWGFNGDGEVGTGSAGGTCDCISSPQVVGGALSGRTVTAVAAGDGHNLALTSGGAVYAWGDNEDGELGNGSTTSSATPVAVTLPSNVTITAIAAGGHHSLALSSTGTVYAWGFNGSGELGDGGTTSSDVPVAVSSLPSNVTTIAAGNGQSLAATPGSVYAWGFNGDGELGNGTTTSSDTPVRVSIPGTPSITALAAGGRHSLAVTSAGVYDWGSGVAGQLGNGGVASSATPVPVTLTGTPSIVAAGEQHSLAVTSTGVFGWGYNNDGELGDGTAAVTAAPVLVSLPTQTALTAIAAGGDHTLGLTTGGSVLAWGSNANGELGTGSASSGGCACSPAPVPVALSLPSGTDVTAIAAGTNYSVALTSAGTVYAWGYNGDGELGNGTTTSSATPVQVNLPSGVDITAIAAGGNHTLALTSTGTVYAWGYNGTGELGNGAEGQASSADTPVLVSLPANTVVSAIAAGGHDSLAVTSSGGVLAWGYNNDGELGDGSLNSKACGCVDTPQTVQLPSGVTATAVAAGSNHSLALTSGGAVYAWGYNGDGQLGNGTTSNGDCSCSPLPVAVSLPSGTAATSIAAGADHSVAVTQGGGLLAWGGNASAQLGTGSAASSGCYCADSPVAVSLPANTTVITPATATSTVVTAGAGHTVALVTGGLNNVVLSPTTATVAPQQTQTYHAEGYDAYGNDLGNVTAATTFSATSPAHCSGNVCSSPSGGSFTISGQDGSAQGTAQLNVTGSGPKYIQDNSPGVSYDSWTSVENSSASGGGYETSDTAGANASLRFTGSSITWITMVGPDQGIAQVSIDGVYQGQVDLYSASRAWQQRVLFNNFSAGTHQIVVRVSGQKAASSSGFSVSINAFETSSGLTDNSSTAVVYDAWLGAESASASGGTYRSDAKADSDTGVRFSGTEVTWVTATGPAYGEAQVYIDGSAVGGVIDLYASSPNWQVQESFASLKKGSHIIVVDVLGRHDASSAGDAVVSDAFIVDD